MASRSASNERAVPHPDMHFSNLAPSLVAIDSVDLASCSLVTDSIFGVRTAVNRFGRFEGEGGKGQVISSLTHNTT